MAALTAAVLCTGCTKKEPVEEPIAATLEVTGIADNQATLKAALTSGRFYGAKLVEAAVAEDLGFDPTDEIRLIRFVEQHGVEVQLPFEKRLTGVKIGKDRLTALIVYEASGRVCLTKTVIWTPAGRAEGWSDSNNPGALEEIRW